MLLTKVATPLLKASTHGLLHPLVDNTAPTVTTHSPGTIIVVCGPAGCGKTTVASHLAHDLNSPFLEGDEFHSSANKSKMGRGVPLDDGDRWGWLHNIREAALAQLQYTDTVVVSCSALKRRYRDIIRGGSDQGCDIRVRFLQLVVSKTALEARVEARPGHHMKKDMVSSQLLALEEAAADEIDVFTLNAQRSIEAVCEEASILAAAVLGHHRLP